MLFDWQFNYGFPWCPVYLPRNLPSAYLSGQLNASEYLTAVKFDIGQDPAELKSKGSEIKFQSFYAKRVDGFSSWRGRFGFGDGKVSNTPGAANFLFYITLSTNIALRN